MPPVGRLGWLAVLAVGILGASCPIRVTITSPAGPVFTEGGSVDVLGRVERLPQGGRVTVGGVPAEVSATPLPPCPLAAPIAPLEEGDGYFRACGVPLSPTANPPRLEAVFAEVRTSRGDLLARGQLMVARGPSVASSGFVADAIRMRLAEGADGIDRVEVALDRILGGIDLYQAGLSQLAYTFYIGTSPFTVTATSAGFASALSDLDPFSHPDPTGVDATHASVTLQGLEIGVTLWNGFPGPNNELCWGTVFAGPTDLSLDIAQEPLATRPSKVDVFQAGPLDVVLGTLTYQDGSGSSCPSSVVTSLLGALQPQIEMEIETALGDPDGWPGDGTCVTPSDCPGDSLLTQAVEGALSNLEVAGPVGDAVGLDLDAEFEAIAEGDTFVDYALRARFSVADPVRAFPRILDTSGPYPGLPAVRPGGAPYGFGLAVSPTALGWLLSATAESGRLDLTLRELVPGVPITVATLNDIPEIDARFDCDGADPDPACSHPARLALQPAVAPILLPTGPPTSPTAELYDLHASGLLVDVIDEVEESTSGDGRLFRFSLDLRARVELEVVVPDRLQLRLSTDPGDVQMVFHVLDRGCCLVSDAGLSAGLGSLSGVLPYVLNGVIPALLLPHVIGLGADAVEVEREGTSSYTQLLADLAFVPVVENPGDRVAHTGRPFTLAIDAWHLDPSEVLSFSVESSDGGPPPSGLTIDGTGVLSWTPAPDQVGFHEVRVSAVDSGGHAGSARFAIQVCDNLTVCDVTP